MVTKISNNGRAFTVNARGQKVDEDGFVSSSFTKKVVISWTCVMVKARKNKVCLRDSKDPIKTTLSFTPKEWSAFVQGVKNGEFDNQT